MIGEQRLEGRPPVTALPARQIVPVRLVHAVGVAVNGEAFASGWMRSGQRRLPKRGKWLQGVPAPCQYQGQDGRT